MRLFITLRVSPGDSVGDSRRWLGRPNIQLVSLLGDVFLDSKALSIISAIIPGELYKLLITFTSSEHVSSLD